MDALTVTLQVALGENVYMDIRGGIDGVGRSKLVWKLQNSQYVHINRHECETLKLTILLPKSSISRLLSSIFVAILKLWMVTFYCLLCMWMINLLAVIVRIKCRS